MAGAAEGRQGETGPARHTPKVLVLCALPGNPQPTEPNVWSLACARTLKKVLYHGRWYDVPNILLLREGGGEMRAKNEQTKRKSIVEECGV